MMKKKQYCRACGPDKGHSFSNCNNGRALREIISAQDNDLAAATETISRLSQEAGQAEQQAANAKFLYRVSVALLDAREATS